MSAFPSKQLFFLVLMTRFEVAFYTRSIYPVDRREGETRRTRQCVCCFQNSLSCPRLEFVFRILGQGRMSSEDEIKLSVCGRTLHSFDISLSPLPCPTLFSFLFWVGQRGGAGSWGLGKCRGECCPETQVLDQSLSLSCSLSISVIIDLKTFPKWKL